MRSFQLLLILSLVLSATAFAASPKSDLPVIKKGKGFVEQTFPDGRVRTFYMPFEMAKIDTFVFHQRNGKVDRIPVSPYAYVTCEPQGQNDSMVIVRQPARIVYWQHRYFNRDRERERDTDVGPDPSVYAIGLTSISWVEGCGPGGRWIVLRR